MRSRRQTPAWRRGYDARSFAAENASCRCRTFRALTITTMGAERRLPTLNLFGLATALMVALAGGAVWALAALWRQDELSFLALPLGLFIGRVLAGNGPRSTALAALCAATFALLASGYALWMIASGRVAMLLGMRLSDILGNIDFELAGAIAWARLDAFDIASVTAGIIAAALAAGLRRGSRRAVQSTGPANS